MTRGPVQAVYTVLREAEHRSTAPLAYWNLPGATVLVPRQKRCQEALKVVNSTLDGLIAKCKALVRPLCITARSVMWLGPTGSGHARHGGGAWAWAG